MAQSVGFELTLPRWSFETLFILALRFALSQSSKDEYKRTYKVESLNKSVDIYNDHTYFLRSYPKGPLLLGSSVWGSAVVLARYLDRSCANYSWIQGKRVLDLSAGTGYVGIVAACLGGDVTVTDVPQMLSLIQKNIDANSEELNGAGGNICAKALLWGDTEAMKSIPKQNIIFLSDVIYTNESVEPLITTVVALSGKGTEIFVSQENRFVDRLNSIWEAFFYHASKYFKFSSIPFDGLHPDYDKKNLWFYRGNYNS